ncbi:hypothetical protein [Jatrophihabitans sp.]|uniref:hypothetical protein n=1 Tax=Jatrophihabitans sp. TaxID=1932789 RepID=UPI002B9D0030|nr:hypothetical protein [Jatrophihabitans sp.]
MTQPNPSHPPRPGAATAEPSGPSGERAGSQLMAGVVLLVLALVVFGVSRVVAARQQHAYDQGASPPPSYTITAGRTYQLSADRSVAELKQAGLLNDLACFTTSVTGEQSPLALSSTADDDRNLHLFATFIAPVTGSIAVSCTGIAGVFVDDADNAAPDRSAVLVLLSGGIGVLGVIAACSGGYARRPREVEE